MSLLRSSRCCSPGAGQRVQWVLSQLDVASGAGCSYLSVHLWSWRISPRSSYYCSLGVTVLPATHHELAEIEALERQVWVAPDGARVTHHPVLLV